MENINFIPKFKIDEIVLAKDDNPYLIPPGTVCMITALDDRIDDYYSIRFIRDNVYVNMNYVQGIYFDKEEKYEDEDIQWFESNKYGFEINDIVIAKERNPYNLKTGTMCKIVNVDDQIDGYYSIVYIKPENIHKPTLPYGNIAGVDGRWFKNTSEKETYEEEDIQWYESVSEKPMFKMGDKVKFKGPDLFKKDVLENKFNFMMHNTGPVSVTATEDEIEFLSKKEDYNEEDIKWFESAVNEKFSPGDVVSFRDTEYVVLGRKHKMGGGTRYSIHKKNPKAKDGMPISADVSGDYLTFVCSAANRSRIEKYKEEDIEWYESKKTNIKMNNLKTFEDFTNEEADYRNVTGYGSSGTPAEQNAGPSFNKGPDAETYNRPDVIGVETDYIEDPYFVVSREQRKKRARKPKYIETLRRDKSNYLNKIDKQSNEKL
jgi:hypothetical protein